MGTLVEQLKQILRENIDIFEKIDKLIIVDPNNTKGLMKIKYEIIREAEFLKKMNEREKNIYAFNQFVKDCKEPLLIAHALKQSQIDSFLSKSSLVN